MPPRTDTGWGCATNGGATADEWGFTDAGGLYWRHYGREAGPPAATGTAAQAAAGLEQLRALTDEADERPWFLWTNFSGPHNPYLVPEPYASLYDWRDVSLPASYHDAGEGKPAYVRRVRESWFGDINEEHTRKSIAHYWGYCTLIDHYVGELLAFLDESWSSRAHPGRVHVRPRRHDGRTRTVVQGRVSLRGDPPHAPADALAWR